MVSRDLDSRLSSREAAAVSEWLKDNYSAFYFMRDHRGHDFAILGGAWGVRIGDLERETIVETFDQAIQDMLFWSNQDARGDDQDILERYQFVLYCNVIFLFKI